MSTYTLAFILANVLVFVVSFVVYLITFYCINMMLGNGLNHKLTIHIAVIGALLFIVYANIKYLMM